MGHNPSSLDLGQARSTAVPEVRAMTRDTWLFAISIIWCGIVLGAFLLMIYAD